MAGQLSQEEIKTYKEQFNAVDLDGSGYLEISELGRLQRKCGFKGTNQELVASFMAVDKNNDKKISFQEYLAVMAQKPKKERTDAAWRKLFGEWDKDGSGSITRDELMAICKKNGFSEGQANAIIEKCDASGDGKISYDEFIKGM